MQIDTKCDPTPLFAVPQEWVAFIYAENWGRGASADRPIRRVATDSDALNGWYCQVSDGSRLCGGICENGSRSSEGPSRASTLQMLLSGSRKAMISGGGNLRREQAEK